MNLLELFVMLSVKDEASKKVEGLSGKLKNGLTEAAKVSAAAITATSAAIGSLAKSAIAGYGEYEQLVGGVKTLFGTEQESLVKYADSVGSKVAEVTDEYNNLQAAQSAILAKASDAYRNVGLSANEYMETVTGFAAALISSLDGDTVAAADKADLAITDMADNANKMGSSMESIQNAYQGFAKQNYTMLDNLKLGYGGTKEEMQRLLNDANKLNAAQGIHTRYSLNSYADIVDAIHVVQTEMGITGTTAEEAATTIQGSLSSAKAAWANLMVGLADDDADLSALILKFTVSAEVAAQNIVPRIEQALTGIGELVTKLSPIIAELLPELINSTLPALLDAGAQLLFGIISGIVEALPELAGAAVELITQLADMLIENLPALLDAAFELISVLADGIAEALPELVPAIVDIALAIVDALIENIDLLVDAAIEIIVALADGLIEALPELAARAPEIIGALVEAIIENVPEMIEASIEILNKLGLGIIESLLILDESAAEVISHFAEAISEKISEVLEIGKNIVDGVWQGISEAKDQFVEDVKGFFGGIIDSVKDFLGIHSPSTVFAEIGDNMAAGVDVGFTRRMGKTAENMKKAFQDALHGLDAEEFDPNKSAAGIMALAIATGDTTLTSLLGEYNTFAELSAGLEARSGMSAAKLYDRMIAAQAIEEENDAIAEATSEETKSTRKTTRKNNTQDLLAQILAKLERINVYLDGDKLVGALTESMDSTLGNAFVLTTRGGIA